MRVTVNINDDTLNAILKITGSRKKTKAISAAVEEFLKQKRITMLLSMRGKLELKNNLAQMKKIEIENLGKLADPR